MSSSKRTRTKAGMMKTPERICRLCSTIVSRQIYVMENTHKDIVEIILPDVKIESSDEVFMCEDCNKLLQEFFQFKSTCLEIEDTIHNYTLEGQVQVDLEKIIGLNDMDHEKKEKICRMCLEFIESESFSELGSDDSSLVQMQQKCLPEMDLLLTKEPVMCDKCENLLKKCFDFLSQCMENEEKHLKRTKAVAKVISTPKRNLNKPNKRDLSLRSLGIDSDSSGEDPDFIPEGESDAESEAEFEDNSDLEDDPQPKTKKRTSKSSNNSLTLHCLYCSDTFTSNDQISVHMVQCKILHEKTKQQNVTTDTSSRTLHCLYCPETFATNDQISVHMVQCKILHEKTKQQSDSSTKTNSSRTLHCLYCPETFVSNDQISVHMAKCKLLHEKTKQQNNSSTKPNTTNTSSRTLHCLYCPETFVSNDQISVHMAKCKKLHEKTKQQKDVSLKPKVTTKNSEDTSNSFEHSDTDISSSIPGADNSDTTQALEKSSENSKEKNVVPDSTNQVQEQFTRYTISSNHRELTILKCDTCDVNTRSFLKIEQHVLSHLHRLRFKTQLLCPHCQKKFDSEQEIYLHLKDKHARCNYKMFHWCVSCTKIFSNRKAIACHWKDCPRKNYICKLFKSNQTMFCMLCNYESDDEKEAKAHRDSCQFKSKTLVGDTIEID